MDQFAKETLPVSLEEEMRRSYLDYAMSVIVGRALPDVRDGLKPVHRRVLYAMHEISNDWNRPYKKSARIVGDVIGKYHPHGDSAVYDTIVRMAQDFSLRYMLIDGQGNFGSVDGDNAAAMHRFEAIAHVWQCPPHDHAHRVIEVGASHLFFEADRKRLLGELIHPCCRLLSSVASCFWDPRIASPNRTDREAKRRSKKRRILSCATARRRARGCVQTRGLTLRKRGFSRAQ